MKESVDREEVRVLAEVAELPLADDRLSPVAELLSAWLPAANELSRKMSAAEHQELMPITVLVHQQSTESKEQ